MTSETSNQLARSPQSSEVSSTPHRDLPVYPPESLSLPNRRPIKANKAKDTDQLMGYLD